MDVAAETVTAGMGKMEPFSVDEKNAAYQKSVELGLSVGYDIKEDAGNFWSVFSSFDADGMGTIDRDEMRMMIESLGMAFTKSEMTAMINEADADKSGDIDFAEFYKVVSKPGGQMEKLFARQKTAVRMGWRTDRMGENVKIDGQVASRSGAGFGVALLDTWVGDNSPKDESKKLNKGSVLLEVDAPNGYVWIGLCGKNFNPEGAHWSQEITNIKNERKGQCFGVRSSDGRISRYGADLTECNGLKLRKYGCPTAMRLQMEIDTDVKEATLKLLDDTNEWEEAGNVTVEEMKHVVAVMVCFGETADGAAPSTVRCVGSSCESDRVRTRRASKDLWDDDKEVGLNTSVNASEGVALTEVMG